MELNQLGAAERFWSDSLGGIDAPTPLMIDQPKDARLSPVYKAVEAEISNSLSKENEAFWLAIWTLLLGRYSNEDSLLFGYQSRQLAWPIAVNLELDNSFTQLQKNIADYLSGIARLPYQNVQELQTQYTTIPENFPMFESLVVFGDIEEETQPTALQIHFVDFRMRITYDSQRLQESAIKRLASHITTLAAALRENPELSLINAPLLPAEEYETVVNTWNATEVDFPDDQCLHQLFEQQVVSQPNASAVVFGSQKLNYEQLNRKANQIARALIGLGVKPNTAVGVSLRRGTDMVAAMMGIAKAGAGYLPLDPDYPVDRLQFMVEDSDVDVLVTQTSLLSVFEESRAAKLVLDTPDNGLEQQATSNPNVAVSPTDLAYLIYTSGSTGLPKGVMVDHRGRVNNFCDFNRRFSVGPGDRLLGLSSMSFDMCAYDVFGTLACGAELVVGESGGDLDPAEWARLMVEHKITVWHSVPALLEMVVDVVEPYKERHPRALRLVLLGGDWIPVTLPDRVKAVAADNVQVISMGGATEVSMDSTIYEIEKTDAAWKSIPYGAPMWNQRAYVLDRTKKPVPIGVPGELYLGGIGVGRGYHNRPELNAEKFIDNPFIQGERLYRTGDLCRWREDGNLQILGRMDFQVKIRGFRIELGEIETALRSHAGVKETVVMAKDGPGGDKRLVAYVIRDNSRDDLSSTSLTPDIRNFLEGRLPHYMVPSAFVYLDAFPLSPNGKVNRRALPEPDNSRPELDVPFVAAGDVLEQVLVQIWTGGLGLDRVGMHDPFVALGGNSLVATQLMARVQEIFQVKLPIKECINGDIHEIKQLLLREGEKIDINVVEIAEIYSQIMTMSTTEVQQQLEKQTQ